MHAIDFITEINVFGKTLYRYPRSFICVGAYVIRLNIKLNDLIYKLIYIQIYKYVAVEHNTFSNNLLCVTSIGKH